MDRDDVRALLALHFAEMRADSPPEACHVLPIDELRDPLIRFLSLRDETGPLLGVGALKTLEPGHGEIKSMRTARTALGRGVGGVLLAYLVATARDMGSPASVSKPAIHRCSPPPTASTSARASAAAARSAIIPTHPSRFFTRVKSKPGQYANVRR